MIWIAWRYQRSVACVLALLALVIIGFTVVTGVIQHHYMVEFMGAPCHGSENELVTRAPGDFCGRLDVRYVNTVNFDSYIKVAGYVIAPLVGAVLGLFALVNEFDHRTARLAWTQSISRSRWFTVKVVVGATSVAVILVPMAIVLSWWNGTIGTNDIFGPQNFGIAGWVLVAYGLFIFALTILLGVLIRRAGWTLAVALLLFLVVAIVVPKAVRVHLVTPTVHWSSIASMPGNGATATYSEAFPANSWLLVNGIIPRSTVGTPTWNEVLGAEVKVETCTTAYLKKHPVEQVTAQSACYRMLHLENASVYIRGDQFWTLQLREGLLYLASGAILIGSAWAYVRRIEP
ncbi:MAG TPA: ABC transporter permease subunit [Acidimicrobiales bacterium]